MSLPNTHPGTPTPFFTIYNQLPPSPSPILYPNEQPLPMWTSSQSASPYPQNAIMSGSSLRSTASVDFNQIRPKSIFKIAESKNSINCWTPVTRPGSVPGYQYSKMLAVSAQSSCWFDKLQHNIHDFFFSLFILFYGVPFMTCHLPSKMIT